MPLDEIPNRIVELRPDSDIVAYCRGPYCVLSPQAVTLLRQHGLQARRLQDGLPEWRLAGLPIAVG
jgi:ArsR family transcriptional regulator